MVASGDPRSSRVHNGDKYGSPRCIGWKQDTTFATSYLYHGMTRPARVACAASDMAVYRVSDVP
jgi:hypothetical protein